MKNKSGLVVVIVVLSVLVGFLGGYIISDKLINKDNSTNENKQNNNEHTNDENNNSNISESITLSEVENLMKKYLISSCSGDSYITSLDIESSVNYLAVQNVKNRQSFSCL